MELLFVGSFAINQDPFLFKFISEFIKDTSFPYMYVYVLQFNDELTVWVLEQFPRLLNIENKYF